MKLGPTLLIVLVGLVLASLWRQMGIRDAVRDAKLQQRAATLDSISQITDTLFADSLSRLRGRIQVAEQVSGSLKHERNRLRSTLDSISHVQRLPDSSRTVDARDTLIAVQDSIILQQDEQISFWKALAASQDSINSRLRNERNRYRDLADTWARRAHPGLAARVARGVPYLLAGAVLWEAVR